MEQAFIWQYLVAFGGGLASFLSPCVLPLVPSYLCYLAGMSANEVLAENRVKAVRREVILATVFFVLGFSLVFVILGAAASGLGQLFQTYREELTTASGILLIVFGLHLSGLLRLRFLDRDLRFDVKPINLGPFGAFMIGFAFGFAWSPCIGLILGPILGLASTQETLSEGALLLTGYALGLGTPFILAGLFSASFLRTTMAIRPYLPWVMRLAGLLLVVTGFAIIFGWLIALNNLILTTFPILGELG